MGKEKTKKKKKNGFFSQFKAFITKGNILDMAVGVIMGSAFGKIVSSLVSDVIMPAVGALVGSGSFSDLKVVIKEAVLDEAGNVVTPESAICYGVFIQNIIDFLIVAFCMFLMIKLFMGMRKKLEKLRRKEEAEEEEKKPAEPTVEEKTLATLTDIKALLEKNGAGEAEKSEK